MTIHGPLTKSQRWDLLNPEKRKHIGQRWRAKNRDRVNEIARRSYHKNIEKIRAYQTATSKRRFLKHRYGLTEAAFDQLLSEQGGLCAICHREPPITSKSKWHGRDWNVDHDHVTKRVRGLLCRECNLGIGHFDDNPLLLRMAVSYLRNSRNNP